MELSTLDFSELTSKFDSSLNTEGLALPLFDVKKERWANVRHSKVEDLASVFSANPNIAYLFEDPKLKGDSLVLLRKSNFESLINVLEDLKSGQVGIQFSTKELEIQLSLLKNLVREKLEPAENNSIQEVLKLISISFSKITSKLFVFSQGKKSEPTPLTSEELEMLGDDEDDQ
jgi:hypothetical protein